ncbi:hypothetical protein AB6A40_009912 [Gnathostoma spinigerum]|uniref:Uncharacterized protein n=1 Tax=Gnathostoma spinigerum TaxID=75299 RepID=A0ABD6F0T2_9BILA
MDSLCYSRIYILLQLCLSTEAFGSTQSPNHNTDNIEVSSDHREQSEVILQGPLHKSNVDNTEDLMRHRYFNVLKDENSARNPHFQNIIQKNSFQATGTNNRFNKVVLEGLLETLRRMEQEDFYRKQQFGL